jgi:HK97 family phage major capsid protein
MEREPTERLTRNLELSDLKLIRAKDEKAVRVSLSASSEREVARWWGTEVLSHEAKAVRLERAKGGAMPLLFNHNPSRAIGMVDNARVEGGRLMVDAHFFDIEDSRTVLAMIEGGLRNVSIGYEIHAVTEELKEERYTAVDWEPFEVSIVTVPADPSVGIGRAHDGAARAKFLEKVRVIRTSDDPAIPADNTRSHTTMDDENSKPAGVSAGPDATAPAAATMSADQIEGARKRAILNLCRGSSLDERFAQNFISRGLSLEAVADEIVKAVAERSKSNPETPALLGMSKRDVGRYSILRALRASMSGDWSKAGLELEAHKAITARGITPRGDKSFFVPYEVQLANPAPGRRDMTVAGVSGSNFIVGTDNLGGSFVDLLRAQSVALRLGVTRLQGLRGNVTIPRQTAGGTVYWLADENTQITESQPTIGQISLTAKNVAALTEISHTLVAQSDPSVETLVLNNIARDIATGVDVAIIRGSGANGQPQGIVGTSGVGAVTGTSLAYAGILEFQSDVGLANALGLPGAAYVTTFPIAADMKNTMKAANDYSPIWEGRMEEGVVDGYPAIATGNMSAGHMMFGAWPSVVLGEWGVLELMMNPFSDFTRGLTSIRGWYTCDVALRYPGAFSVSTNVT